MSPLHICDGLGLGEFLTGGIGAGDSDGQILILVGHHEVALGIVHILGREVERGTRMSHIDIPVADQRGIDRIGIDRDHHIGDAAFQHDILHISLDIEGLITPEEFRIERG